MNKGCCHPLIKTEPMKIVFACLMFLFLLSYTACNKGPVCPAYNSVHTNKDYGYNPNNAARKKNNNKKDVEAKKKSQLSKKASRPGRTSLFPKGMGPKSR